MKKLLRGFFILFLLSAFFLPAKATHIVGGDVTVKYLSANNYEVTLTLFFDCINGSPAAFDPSVNMGVFDKVTNAMVLSPVLPFVDSVTLVLGDSCFIPQNLCVRKQRYIGNITLPNNPNGYYMSWHRCCRNIIITNISNPGGSGNVFYVEIPDPAIVNSTPVFSTYPDAYMCVGFPNSDNFAATDADGDSLVYTLVDPYDCAVTNICGSSTPPPLPPPAPGPYGTVPWFAPYSSVNMMGDPAQSINNQTGFLFTSPPTQGVFVICVKVEEFRNAVKIGEIRRDVQYAVLNCNIPNVQVSGPNPICLGQSTTLIASGGTSYSWSTGATTTSIVVSPTSTGSYDYYVSTSNGLCTALDSINILVAPNVTISATAIDDTICAGDTTSLITNATGGGGYLWNPSGTLTCSNCPNPIASPSSTTTYTVISTNGFGCGDTATVTVATVGSVPVITGNSPLCLGQSSTLTATGSASYSWSTGATTSSIVVSPVTAGTYSYVVAGGVAPCMGMDTFVVVVNPAAAATATAVDDTICLGNSTTLIATGGGTYAWSPATGLSNPSIANPSATPVSTTTYVVTVTNSFGCTATASTVVVPVPAPTVAMGPAQTLCLGDSVQLSANATPPSGVSYSWVPATGLSCTNCQNPWTNTTFSNTYTVYVSSSSGCTAAGTVAVTVGSIPFVSAIAPSTICNGDSAQLFANTSNGTGPYSYYWSPPNDLNNPTLQNPTSGAANSTPYTVTVTDANGCTDDTTTFLSVETVPSVTWASWTPDLTCDGYIIPLKANVSSNGQQVIWNFGDGSAPLVTYAPNTDAGPHAYPFNGTYTLTVVVFNVMCTDTVDTTLVISDMSGFLSLMPANVFTPNSDGMNDCFHPAFIPAPNSNISPDTLESLQECLEMEVWDRWGIKMFESSPGKKCWDGKTTGGKDAKDGTYYYIAKFGEIYLPGYVTVLRTKN